MSHLICLIETAGDNEREKIIGISSQQRHIDTGSNGTQTNCRSQSTREMSALLSPVYELMGGSGVEPIVLQSKSKVKYTDIAE